MQKMSKAIDKVRAAEVKQLKADGYEEVLKGGRWLLLKRPENLTEKQAVKLSTLLEYNLKSVRSLPDERGLSTILDIHVCGVGRASFSTLGVRGRCAARSNR